MITITYLLIGMRAVYCKAAESLRRPFWGWTVDETRRRDLVPGALLLLGENHTIQRVPNIYTTPNDADYSKPIIQITGGMQQQQSSDEKGCSMRWLASNHQNAIG
jgi:hypothetical protein